MNPEAWYRKKAFPHLDPGPEEPPVYHDARLWLQAMAIAFPALRANPGGR